MLLTDLLRHEAVFFSKTTVKRFGTVQIEPRVPTPVAWYSHVSRSSGLAQTILQGTVKGEEDKADKGRGGKTSLGNGQA